MCAVLNMPVAVTDIDLLGFDDDDIAEFILAENCDLMHERYLHVIAALLYAKNGEWDVTGDGDYHNQTKKFVEIWKQGCNTFIDDLDEQLYKIVEKDFIKSGWEKNQNKVEDEVAPIDNSSTPPLMQILGSIKKRECEIVKACRKGPPFPSQIPEQRLFIQHKPCDYITNLYEKIHFKYDVKGAPLKTPPKNNSQLHGEDSTNWELHQWESQEPPMLW